MFPELNNLCDFSVECLPCGRFILVGEGDADGSFVINHMVCMYLKAKQPVHLLALTQTFTHYNTICNKLGVNLIECRDEGRIVFQNGINDIGGNIVEASGCGDSNECCISYGASDNSSLKPLYHLLKESVRSLSSNDKLPLVVIDDLSILVSIGIPTRDILILIQYLRRAIEDVGGCLVVLTHYKKNTEDDDLELLWKEMYYHCDLSLLSKGLDSGYSHDVHGQVSW